MPIFSIFLPPEVAKKKEKKKKKRKSTSSTVLNLDDEHVRCAGGDEIVHDERDAVPFDHGLDGHPSGFFELGDGRGALAGGDAADVVEAGAVDVVCAEDVALGGFLNKDKS